MVKKLIGQLSCFLGLHDLLQVMSFNRISGKCVRRCPRCNTVFVLDGQFSYSYKDKNKDEL